tara:strand:+ start:3189 stop:3374 length:186 start_codon:yes stop_codon:yes gene_type:complete
MKNKWTVEYEKGTEIFVSNEKHSIFIGECDQLVSKKKKKINMTIAIIISDALNKNNPYEKD